MTHEMAKTLVRQIQNFCNEKTSCNRCPFRIKIDFATLGCEIGYPCDWEIEYEHIVRQKVRINNDE